MFTVLSSLHKYCRAFPGRLALPYQLLANLVLIVHVAFVAFVIGGLVLVIVGNFCRWQWINTFWFRLAHLAAIATVVAEVWLRVTCPLTALEMWLRMKARSTTYTGSFIEHWLQWALYYTAPPWVFILAYSLFGLLVLATWWYFPPRRPRMRQWRSTSPKNS